MTEIAVGQPLDPRRLPRPEGVYFQTKRGGHVLYAFYDDPDRSEVAAYQHGAIELALFVDHPAVFVLAHVGAQPWVDAPYSWHLVPEAHRAVPEGDLLTIVLADARNTIVRALRVASMPPAVASALRDAIAVQAASPWDIADRRAYDIRNAEITGRYETAQLLEHAIARGRAGR